MRIRVLTNSLASNDAPAAHAGYARYRKDLLAMGVELYEMRGRTGGHSAAGLHAGRLGQRRGGSHKRRVARQPAFQGGGDRPAGWR